mmetsp:Transcript_17711/g.33867  ORF Transcript_17711/g.33867 Transcript_17711/m.33867 type:complete len:292 (+) Transcript_17711:924-1799(+)
MFTGGVQSLHGSERVLYDHPIQPSHAFHRGTETVLGVRHHLGNALRHILHVALDGVVLRMALLSFVLVERQAAPHLLVHHHRQDGDHRNARPSLVRGGGKRVHRGVVQLGVLTLGIQQLSRRHRLVGAAHNLKLGHSLDRFSGWSRCTCHGDSHSRGRIVLGNLRMLRLQALAACVRRHASAHLLCKRAMHAISDEHVLHALVIQLVQLPCRLCLRPLALRAKQRLQHTSSLPQIPGSPFPTARGHQLRRGAHLQQSTKHSLVLQHQLLRLAVRPRQPRGRILGGARSLRW